MYNGPMELIYINGSRSKVLVASIMEMEIQGSSSPSMCFVGVPRTDGRKTSNPPSKTDLV